MSGRPPIQELMAVLCAREVRPGEPFGAGIQSLIAATGAVLAKHLHAPDAPLVTRGLKGSELVSGAREPHQMAMSGKLGLFFLTPAQIDGEANVNFERVRKDGGWSELSGAFAVPVYYAVVRRVVLLCPEHSPAVLVRRVDHVTASGRPAAGEKRIGGPSRIITSKAVLRVNRQAPVIELQSYHPGESVESVRQATGFDLAVAEDVCETPGITEAEAHCLETVVYPSFARTALPWRRAAGGPAAS